jgi:hypothetical protein
MTDRHSKAIEPEIVVDPSERAKLEARNALEQFDAVISVVEQYTESGHPPFRLRPSIILQLQRIALKGLSAYAGVFRPAGVDIGGSKHKPTEAHLVPTRIEEMCDYLTDHWSKPPIHLMAYALWRLNWIEAADAGDLAVLEKLLAALLAKQLYDIHRVATEGNGDDLQNHIFH